MHEQEIRGRLVTLRPATPADRRQIYEWSAHSDAMQAMMGPPTFPDKPIPTWEEFCDDYVSYYFDDSAPLLGRCFVILVDGTPVGQVNYNDIEERGGAKRTELDIWLGAERWCGRGSGTDALVTLCRYLARAFGVQAFVVQPSARNPRAIHAYEKVGFRKLELSLKEAKREWGPSDYYDGVYMVRRVRPEDLPG
jgi:diamine N-acetyltransferase